MTVVTFDLWNTLVELSPSEARSYVLRRHALGRAWLAGNAGGRLPPGLARVPVVVRREADRWEHRGKVMTIPEQARRMARLARRPRSPGPYREALRALVRSLPVRPREGALELLADLSSQGRRLGLISNLTLEPPEAVRELVERLRLGHYLEVLVFSSEVGCSKPDPRPFARALRALGGTPNEAVHVGDSYSSDVAGALAAGWRGAVLLLDPRRSPGPGGDARVERVHRLSEVPDALRRLLPPG
jgi:putative hydrolase of the HAD superfamily